MPSVTNAYTTPDRHSVVVFDEDEVSIAEEAWGVTRSGGDIASPSIQERSSADNRLNMRFLASGGWALQPLQQEITNIHEYEAPQKQFIVPLTKMNVAKTQNGDVLLRQTLAWRDNSDLPGMIIDPKIAKAGDPFLIKEVPAGQSWDNQVTSGVDLPDGIPLDIPLDRIAESNEQYPADQGWFLRWTLPGTGQHYPGYVWSFYFGQYCATIKGNGQCILWEFCHDVTGAPVTRQRAQFRYARPSQVSQASHTLLIWPHRGEHGEQLISFSGNQLDAAGYISGQVKSDASQVAPTEYVYKADAVFRAKDRNESPGHSTAKGLFRFDVRRDLLLKLQISTLGYPTSGTLVDLPDTLPSFTSDAQPLEIGLKVQKQTGTDITAQILDADSGQPFVIGTHTKPFVKFTFTSDGTSSPILWSYTLKRNAVQTVSSPGAFTGGNLRQYSIVGYSGDPSTLSANIEIEDVYNQLPRLRSRGELACRILTEFPTQEGIKTATLFRGRVIRPVARRMAGNVNWTHIEAPCLGMWARLSERIHARIMRAFADDTLPPPLGHSAPKDKSGVTPWKVTDALREVLSWCGFVDSQINIPDLPFRFWPGQNLKAAEDVVQPRADYGELLQKWAKNYLSSFLIWEENAPGGGWWTLLQAKLPPFTPIWNFVTDAQKPGIPTNLRGAYNASTTFITELSTQPIAPEFNTIVVLCPVAMGDSRTKTAVQSSLINYKSFQVPGSSVVPDPNHPDYIGHSRPCVIIDTSLAGVANETEDQYEVTQRATNWLCTILFDRLCHAQILSRYTAPLQFVIDPDIANNYRPLRFNDEVGINGEGSLLKSVNMTNVSDTMQMAQYEALRPILP